jgi:NADPH:quinone reductase-like Zn-dependent oxidoreductase/predicted MFS family arabinose efflux permease
LASIVVSLLAASSAPTPLYAVYQAEWGFSAITTTVVFGVYALAVLASLLTLGKLSDHLGRRPVLLAAIAVQAVSMVVFVTASGVTELLIARVVQGISTGAAIGAVGAGMLDIDRRRGTLANSVAPGVGTGAGALVSAIVVQFLPAPTHLIYLVLLTVLVVQAVGVALITETVRPKAGALASIVPEIKLPKTVRRPVFVAAPVLLAVWALAGFYGSLGPALVRGLTNSSSVVYGGLSLFVLACVAAISVLLLRKAPARRVMLIGVFTLIVGVAGTLVAIDAHSAVGFFIGTAVSGIGFGSGFQGSIRTVMPLAAAHERSGVLSLLYVVSYLGLGAPAVLAGFLVVHGGGVVVAAREYGLTVIVLAALAFLGLLRGRVRTNHSTTQGGAFMRAIGVTSFGGPEQLQTVELATPEPGPGEVRIRVQAATVNPTDTVFRAGAQAARLTDRQPPFVPGMDAAGIIDKLGPDVADRLAVGDQVVTITLPAGPYGGAYVDQLVAPAVSVVHAPAGVAPTTAATLAMNALTARLALDTLALVPGQTVAVTGAAGAFGGYVVQLAKADGLRVVADAAAQDRALVESLGADIIVERGDEVATAIRAVAGTGVDGLVDGSNQRELLLGAVRDGGGLISVRGWDGPGERGVTVTPVFVASVAKDTAMLERLRDQVEQGVLTLRVADVLPAEQAAEAHRRYEAGGVRGRLVLDFS